MGKTRKSTTLSLEPRNTNSQQILEENHDDSAWVTANELAEFKGVSLRYVFRFLKKENLPVKKALNPKTNRLVTWVYVGRELKSKIEKSRYVWADVTITEKILLQVAEAGLLSPGELIRLKKIIGQKPVTVRTKLPIEIVIEAIKK